MFYLYHTSFFPGRLFSQEEKEKKKKANQTPNPDMFMACKLDQLTTVVIKHIVTLALGRGTWSTEPSNPVVASGNVVNSGKS